MTTPDFVFKQHFRADNRNIIPPIPMLEPGLASHDGEAAHSLSLLVAAAEGLVLSRAKRGRSAVINGQFGSGGSWVWDWAGCVSG